MPEADLMPKADPLDATGGSPSEKFTVNSMAENINQVFLGNFLLLAEIISLYPVKYNYYWGHNKVYPVG